MIPAVTVREIVLGLIGIAVIVGIVRIIKEEVSPVQGMLFGVAAAWAWGVFVRWVGDQWR